MEKESKSDDEEIPYDFNPIYMAPKTDRVY